MAVAKKAEEAGFVDRMTDRFRNFGKRFGYFKDVWNEMRKVHWPSRQQLLTYTGVVIVSVGIIALLVWIVDSGLSYVMNLLLGS